jgi:hypothetical protein
MLRALPLRHALRTTLRATRGVVLAFAALPSARPASTQTTDPIFRSWRWTEDVTMPRPLGLGGAVVGLADDGAAAVYNPAGLPTVPRAGELQFGLRLPGDVTLANGDRIRHRLKGASPGAFVLRLGTRVGVSYHFVTYRPATLIEFDDGRRTGALQTSVNGPGAGIGVRVSPFVNLGLSLNAVRFYVNHGEYTETGTGTGTAESNLRVRFSSSGDTRITGTVGALVKARELSFGLTFRRGHRWRGERRASNPATGMVVDEGTLFRVHSPSVASAGVAWQPEKVRRAGTLVLTGQIDRVLLGTLKATSVPGIPFPAGAYKVESAWELRAGVETTIPFITTWASRGRPWRPNRLQFRAGWHRQGAGTFVFQGGDPVERATFPGGGTRNLWSVGTSIGGTTIWRVSGTYRFGAESRLAVVGVTIRYPGLFP